MYMLCRSSNTSLKETHKILRNIERKKLGLTLRRLFMQTIDQLTAIVWSPANEHPASLLYFRFKYTYHPALWDLRNYIDGTGQRTRC